MLLSCLITAGCFAQKVISKDTIEHQLRQIRNYVAQLKPMNDSTKSAMEDCVISLNDAITNVATHGDEFPVSYSKALADIVAFSKEIATQNDDDRAEMIRLLNKDITLKFGPNSNGLSNKINTGLVAVKVITTTNGVPVHNLRVHYCALGYNVNFLVPEHSYSRLTSPGEEVIVPGYYKFWVTRDGDTVVLRSIKKEIIPPNEVIIQFEIPKQ